MVLNGWYKIVKKLFCLNYILQKYRNSVGNIAYVTAKKDLTFLFNNICYNRIVTGNEMIGEHYE